MYRAEDEARSGQAVDDSPPSRTLSRRWAELLYRIYEVDPLTCPPLCDNVRETGRPIEINVEGGGVKSHDPLSQANAG
jgi:hypothetical protein